MAGLYDFGGLTSDQIASAVGKTNTARATARERTQRATQRMLDLQYLERDRTFGDALADTAIGIGQGVVSLGEAGYGLANLLTLGGVEAATDLAGNFEETRQILDRGKSDQLLYRRARADQAFEERGVLGGLSEYITDPALLGDLAATNLPSIIPAGAAASTAARTVVAGGAARGLGREAIQRLATQRAASAASLTGGAQMGGAAYVEAYRQAIDEGLTPEQANERALAAGAATGAAGVAISRLPGVGAAGVEGQVAARVSGVAGATAGVARDVATATGREAAEEALQSGAEQTILNAASERRALLDDVAKTAALGSLGGGLLGVGMGAVRAPSQLRQQLEQGIESTAAELGDPSVGRSNLEQMGDSILEGEEIELQPVVTPEVQALLQAGFEGTGNGTFRRPGDPLFGDQELSLAEALEIASQDVVLDDTLPPAAAEDLAAGVAETVPEDIDLADVPLSQEPRQPEVGARAYQKLRTALEEVGYQRDVVDGAAVYRGVGVVDGVETTVELSEVEAIEAARQAGLVEGTEATAAAQYAAILDSRRSTDGAPAPRQGPPVRAPLTAEEADRQMALRQSGYVEDQDGTYWTLDDDGAPIQLSQDKALERVGYVPSTQDLLGDPAATPVTPQVQATSTETAGGLFATDGDQLQLRGLDPLYDAVSDARRREYGRQVLTQLAGTNPVLPSAPEAEQRAGWDRILEQAVEVYNGRAPTRGSTINYNQAMRRSSLIRSFVNDAVAQGLTPDSAESFDYIQERARAAEVEGRKAAHVLGALADLAGAIAPGTASLARWKTALTRRGVAKPGQMRGSAFQKFKSAVEKATITPGSTEFDSFMTNFVASLPEKDTKAGFGALLKSKYAPTRSVPEVRPPKPVTLSAGVEEDAKTPQEAVLTQPTELPEGASEKAREINAQKAKVQADMAAAAEEQAAAEEELLERTARARARPEDLVDDEPTDVDPDVARAEEEAPRQQVSQATADEINQVFYEADQRVKRTAARLAEDILDLKAAYATGKAQATQVEWDRAINDAVGERLAILDTALSKDITDVTSWLALTSTVLQNPQVAKYASDKAKAKKFVAPMLYRFSRILGEGKSPDVIRMYREALRESGVREFVDNQITGDDQVRAREALAALDEMIDTQLDRKTQDPANPANKKPFVRKPKMSRTADGRAATGGMDVAQLQTYADAYNAQPGGRIQVEVAPTVAAAERALGVVVPSSANGVYYGGRAIAIAENITSKDEAYEVMLHERTHGGLEALLGADRLNATNNRLWANGQIRKRIQAKMRSLGLSRAEAAEEVLVDMAVGGETLNRSTMAKVRAGINRFAETILGVSDYSMPDSMVNQLLKDTADYLRGAKSELTLGESYLDGLSAYMQVADGASVPSSPKFSVASARVNEFSAGESSDVVRLQDSYSEYLREGMQNNLAGRAGDTAVSVRDRARRFSMDFMPASQIANLNQGLFYNELTGTDLLEKFVNDKLAKENDFNKVIQQQRELKYKAPDGEKTFNESMISIAQRWQRVTFKSGAQTDALNTINQDGTFYKVHPDRSWEQQTQLDYTKQNYSEGERRQAYTRVREQWDRLTPENKELYQQVQAAYGALWAERMAEVKRLAAQVAEDSDTLPDPDNPDQRIGTGEWQRKTERKVETVLGRISEGPYSPLQRFGDYYVTIRDRLGEVVFNSGHETLAEAEATRRSMESQLEEGYRIVTQKREEFVGQLDGMSKRQYDRVTRALEGVFPADDETDRHARADALRALQEVYLQSQPDSSLLVHANARKNIAGATTDSFRAYNDYVIKSARNLSSMRYDYQIQGALNEMKRFRPDEASTALNVRRADVMSAIQKQHLASQQFKSNSLSEFATQASFLMWMTSPSQLFLNASQTALVTLPRLAARYGVGSMIQYIGEASSGFVKSKTRGMHSEDGGLNPNSAMYKVLQNLYQAGTLDFTLTHDVSDMAQRSSDLAHSRWREATKALAVWIHKSEVYNREVAAFAVVRGEMRKAGITDAQFEALQPAEQQGYLNTWTTEAKRAVLETQFEYSQSNKASATQGPVARVVFQFQQFRLNMLAMMAKDVRDSVITANPALSTAEARETKALARRTLTYMTVTQLLMTGATGSVLAPVVFGIMRMLQDDDELLSPEEQFLQAAPQWLSMGLMSGALDPQRFGFNTLLPIIGGSRYMPTSDDPQQTVDHILLNSLGPAYGLASQWIDGSQLLAEGRYSQAIGKILPKPFADAYAANVENLDGIKDRQGIAWYQPNSWDRVVNTLGLRSGDQATAQADRSAIYGGQQRATDRRRNLVSRWVTADNYDDRVAAMEDITAWNQRWGRDESLSISQSTLTRAQKTRLEKTRMALETGVPSTRVPDAVKELIRD